ncbi:MAG: UDP-N-acetylmuramate--L-alanine ligase [bacterium]|nr:UDP-N-acetylmuramate--L-alanine ligase [bacterium]
MIDLEKIRSVYFIGIGGSGMSSIANMMIAKSKIVLGSDKESSINTQELERRGTHIFYEQNGTNLSKEIELVIYTVAIPDNNPELLKAKELNIPLLSYPQILNLISKEMITIAIAGTHGKTTTTAMLAHILKGAHIKPTVIVGSATINQKINFIEGKGEYLLVEADEYRKSFLNLKPKYLVITNIDEDHLDFFKNLEDIQNTFKDLVAKIPTDGFLVCDSAQPHLKPILENIQCKVVKYESLSKEIKLLVPGHHNRQNAGAAFALASILGLSREIISKKLRSFRGVRRRFEYKGKTVQGALIYDDYAHNPQKILSALQGAREMHPDKRIIAVFQPHLYSRTKTLLQSFKHSFKDADQVLLAPIYAAREEFDPSISSEILAREIIKNGIWVEAYPSIEAIKIKLNQTLTKDVVVVILGAGDITKLSETLIFSSTY